MQQDDTSRLLLKVHTSHRQTLSRWKFEPTRMAMASASQSKDRGADLMPINGAAIPVYMWRDHRIDLWNPGFARRTLRRRGAFPCRTQPGRR